MISASIKLLPVRPKLELERKQVWKKMTVAIASKCTSGVILCADKNVILSDGSKTIGRKIYARDLVHGSVALASSTSNGIAAESLAIEILDDLADMACDKLQDIRTVVCQSMQRWQIAYGQQPPPDVTYLMVACAAGQQEVYVLEPPRNVLAKHAYAIGSGARVAQPMLDRITTDDALYQPKTTLMYLMYMAKHAEKEEAFVGGGFDALYLPAIGSLQWVDPFDLLFAEEMVFTVDACIDLARQFLMSLAPEAGLDTAMEHIQSQILFVAKQLSTQTLFPSLKI